MIPVVHYLKFATKELGSVCVKKAMMVKDVTDANQDITDIQIVAHVIVVMLEVPHLYVMLMADVLVSQTLLVALVTNVALDTTDSLGAYVSMINGIFPIAWLFLCPLV